MGEIFNLSDYREKRRSFEPGILANQTPSEAAFEKVVVGTIEDPMDVETARWVMGRIRDIVKAD